MDSGNPLVRKKNFIVHGWSPQKECKSKKEKKKIKPRRRDHCTGCCAPNVCKFGRASSFVQSN